LLDSKEIELQVIDSSKFSSEGFQFTIERFCTCISSLVIEEVENTLIMLHEGFDDGVKLRVMPYFHTVEPQGEFRPGHVLVIIRGVNVSQLQCEVIELLYVGQLLKQHLSPGLL
jgi:hypothetical protein